MADAFIIDAIRTPIGRYGGALSTLRADDLAAIPIRALLARNQSIPAIEIADVILGCANQAGEDNRNVARMALLLAGLPYSVPGMTINRLCASGLSAVVQAANALKLGRGDLYIAGGVEHMTRAPYVMAKPDAAFSRTPEIFDSTIGWRFVNPALKARYGIDSMGETAENVAELHKISRADQDAFALRSQQRAADANKRKRFEREIIRVEIADKSNPVSFSADEFPRADSTIAVLSKLKPAFRKDGTVTAGNSSGINDGACALLLASETAVKKFNLKPLARILGDSVVGVEPRLMGLGPVPATEKLLKQSGITLADIQVIELNEAFAAQSLACLRLLGLADDALHVNPNGGAIALGHPLGMSGARLISTACYELQEKKQRYALCAMCVGVGQGAAVLIERT